MRRGALIAAAAAVGAFLAGGVAEASGPVQGGLNLRPPATALMADVVDFHTFLLATIAIITALVLALLLWVMIRYNRRANPTPHKFTHNMLVEVVWTIVPVLILVVIAWRSFPLLYEQERVPADAELTLKVTGNSWFWGFEYPDLGVQVVANLLPEEEAQAQNRPYLLAVDNALYVPVDTTVRVLVTSNDVIHSFSVPEFGIKEDAIQGRINETWFRADREGVFYGQCYELCGLNHAYMPYEVHVVSREEFDSWVVAQGGSLDAGEAPAAPAAAQPAPAAPEQEPAAPAGTPTR